MKDVTGQKWYRLTALRFVGWRSFPSGFRMQVWEFECECGKRVEKLISNVKTGGIKSCGCLRNEYYHRPRKTQHEHYMAHREARLAAAIEYRKRTVEQRRDYARKNRHYYALKAHERRAKERLCSVDGRVTFRWLKNIRKKSTVRCYYCGKKIHKSKAEVDHVIPLIENGPHAIGNLALTCEHCNATKSRKRLGQWQPPGQQVLSL